jgi:large subunit ribosomal protein L17
MRHTKAGRKLSRPADHRRALLRNLMAQLFTHERIKTTEAKAKAVRPEAERLISLAKGGDVHARREILKEIHDKSVVDKLIHVIGPDMADRPGGYTRIVRVGTRAGDAAPMVLLELVQ